MHMLHNVQAQCSHLGIDHFCFVFFFSVLGELLEEISIIQSYDLLEENSLRFIEMIISFVISFCLIHLNLTTENSYKY